MEWSQSLWVMVNEGNTVGLSQLAPSLPTGSREPCASDCTRRQSRKGAQGQKAGLQVDRHTQVSMKVGRWWVAAWLWAARGSQRGWDSGGSHLQSSISTASQSIHTNSHSTRITIYINYMF